MKEQPKRKIMRKFRIDEISIVDRPAQEGAKIVIMKRDDSINKKLLSPKDGENTIDFISRFMADEKMKSEFPKKDQRAAVARQQMRRMEKAQRRVPSGSSKGGQFSGSGGGGGGNGVEAQAKIVSTLRAEIKAETAKLDGMRQSKKAEALAGKISAMRTKLRQEERKLDDMHGDNPILFGPAPGGGAAMGKSMKTKFSKRLRLLTSVDGHTHLINDSDEGGMTSYEVSEGSERSHSHPWVKNDDGSIIIGMAEGHGHSVIDSTIGATDDMMKAYKPKVDDEEELEDAAEEAGFDKEQYKKLHRAVFDKDEGGEEPDVPSGADNNVNKDDDMDTKVLMERLEKAELLASMSDAEKDHFNSLNGDAKTAFAKMDKSGRGAELAKKADANPIVYTSENGQTFRKNDDPRLVDMAKERDADRRVAKQEREERQNMTFAKRAKEELGFLSGADEDKVNLLRALDSITDVAQRDKATQILKGANSAVQLAASFQKRGDKEIQVSASSPEGQLRKLAQDRFEKSGGKLTFEKAYSEVMDTPEGTALYTQMMEEQANRQ